MKNKKTTLKCRPQLRREAHDLDYAFELSAEDLAWNKEFREAFYAGYVNPESKNAEKMLELREKMVFQRQCR